MLRVPPSHRRLALALTGLVGVAASVITAIAPAGAEEAPGPPRVVAADGATADIDAINPSSRGAGVLALYTPEAGAETKTNEWGGEAVLRRTDQRDVYRVESVCTVFGSCDKPGNNQIPSDGAVLSASPPGAGDTDDRRFLQDHLKAGDEIRLENLLIRSATATADAVDPTAQSNPGGVDPESGQCYPGCRGAEQLIVYTSASGRERTGTNDYGYEVVVRDGRVVERGGNNSAIPPDGFVVSGHGGRGSWLEGNALLGAQVTRDGETLTIVVDARTYLLAAERGITAASGAYRAARESCLPVDATRINDALDTARAEHADAERVVDSDPHRAVELARQASGHAATAQHLTYQTRAAEGRGIWVRPIETTPEQIRATLNRIDRAGFNIVFLETLWQGYTIFPSKTAAAAGVAPQRPNMVGFDPLKVWIAEAHKRDIELHAWVHTFFVGADSTGGAGPILEAHPEWAAVEREDVGKSGPQPSRMESGYYFVDPAMPEPRRYLREVFTEILADYPVDGLHLDYIRYPVSLPFGADFSYSDHARSAFAEDHGIDPYHLNPDHELWPTWNRWREQRITSFVTSVREMQQRVVPQRQLSAAVFADPKDGLEKKFQNWGAWVDAGLMDFLTGMSFGTSADSVGRDTAAMRDRVGDVPLYTATYGPFRGSAPELILEQIGAVRAARSDGAALFAYNQLSARQAAALTDGSFRAEAVTPHADFPAATRIAVKELRRTLAQAESCAPQRELSAIDGRLRAAAELLADPTPSRVRAARDQLAAALREAKSWDAGVHAAFAARTVQDVDMAHRWLRHHLTG